MIRTFLDCRQRIIFCILYMITAQFITGKCSNKMGPQGQHTVTELLFFGQFNGLCTFLYRLPEHSIPGIADGQIMMVPEPIRFFFDHGFKKRRGPEEFRIHLFRIQIVSVVIEIDGVGDGRSIPFQLIVNGARIIDLRTFSEKPHLVRHTLAHPVVEIVYYRYHYAIRSVV